MKKFLFLVSILISVLVFSFSKFCSKKSKNKPVICEKITDDIDWLNQW